MGTQQKRRSEDESVADMSFDEALTRLAQTKPGELADAITRDLVNEMGQARDKIRAAREGIERGARTRGKKDRFRL